jgi:hypothetical protein
LLKALIVGVRPFLKGRCGSDRENGGGEKRDPWP